MKIVTTVFLLDIFVKHCKKLRLLKIYFNSIGPNEPGTLGYLRFLDVISSKLEPGWEFKTKTRSKGRGFRLTYIVFTAEKTIDT